MTEDAAAYPKGLETQPTRCSHGAPTYACNAREEHLAESLAWWKSEWEHKNREADALWLTLLGMALLVGLAFFAGTVVG